MPSALTQVIKSRVPDDPSADDAMRPFFDALDRRQIKLGQLELLSDSASTADIIAKVNEIIMTARIR